MLGENAHHGGGNTLKIKAELVQRLIERCGFNAVYFESGVYEFADLTLLTPLPGRSKRE